MTENKLEAKQAYFKLQEILDNSNSSDDEGGSSNEALRNAARALAEFDAVPPLRPNARLVRQPSSFLGPTPKERQQLYLEGRILSRNDSFRVDSVELIRSNTEPASAAKSLPAAKPPQRQSSDPGRSRSKLKKKKSQPDLKAQDAIPFYKRMGTVPRELKQGKNVKLADNIKLEERQLLRGKVVYFFPNDDISLPRRRRIHKIIQLGAAWAKEWRDDVTHVMVDDECHTYSQLLRNINQAGFPRKIVLVKFDPYIPDSINLGMLLDPTAGRFAIKGAPKSNRPSAATEMTHLPDSQISLKIKPSGRQLAAEFSQMTDSIPSGSSATRSNAGPEIRSFEDVVKDSFIYSSSPARNENPQHVDAFNDALSEAIQQTKAVAHLPLDEDEESDSRPSSSSSGEREADSDNENRAPCPKRAKTSRHTYAIPKAKGSINQNAFQCMDPIGKSSPKNPNAKTIEILDQMCKYYDQMNDQWRTLAYRKAITTLRKQTTKVCTAEEAVALPFIGSRLAEKIEEIVLTDRLRRLDSTKDDPTDQVLRLFLGVYGAGLVQANKWVQAGYRTLDDVVTKAKLTESQKIGIEHYHDFAARIPRAEVEAHGAVIQNALKKLDPSFQAFIMGSYRRGAKDSGDIDLIITKPGAPIAILREVVFNRLVPLLTKAGFLKVKLATSSRHEDGTKWHGASYLPSSKIWRRVDLLLVPGEELGAALIYFTGNDIFNRSIRLLASKKGMRLNQKGLYKDVIRGKNRERLTEGTLIEGRDEKKIFEILGVPWREPTERIC